MPGGTSVRLIDPTTGAPYRAGSNAAGQVIGSNAAPTVISEGASAKTDRSIAAPTTSTQVAPANANRRKLIFQNLDAAINVHVNVGAVATADLGSIRITPGASFELTGTSEAVNIIAASGTPKVTIWEM